MTRLLRPFAGLVRVAFEPKAELALENVVLHHGTRRVLHANVTRHPTSEWIVQQLREAFPYDEAPRYLIHDGDAKFSDRVTGALASMGGEPKRTSYRSPWQNGIAERWVGCCRRELLDHVVPLGERHLRRLLGEYVRYHNEDRTHIGLAKETAKGRPTTPKPDPGATLLALPKVGWLHYRYEWRAAA